MPKIQTHKFFMCGRQEEVDICFNVKRNFFIKLPQNLAVFNDGPLLQAITLEEITERFRKLVKDYQTNVISFRDVICVYWNKSIRYYGMGFNLGVAKMREKTDTLASGEKRVFLEPLIAGVFPCEFENGVTQAFKGTVFCHDLEDKFIFAWTPELELFFKSLCDAILSMSSKIKETLTNPNILTTMLAQKSVARLLYMPAEEEEKKDEN